MDHLPKRYAVLLTIGAFAITASSAAETLDWSLPSGTRMEGDTLAVEIAPDATVRRDVRASAEIDIADAFAAMQCVAVTVGVRGRDVSEPPHAWQGVKVQLSYTDCFGDRVYRDASLPRGTFDRTNVTVRVSPLLAPLGIPGGRVSLLLGLEGCTGRAEFDLSSLRIDREDTGIPRAVGANDGAPQSGAMKGAAAQQRMGAPMAQMNDASSFVGETDTLHSAEGGPSFVGNADTLHSREAGSSLPAKAVCRRSWPLRGAMLPARATTEDDIRVLAGWGATLVRFQITRDFGKVGANSDLAQYAVWVDSRLDNLAQVLDWCVARGMKVCVDLHATPGGIRAGDRATAMLYDKRLADAYVETWRRIATRCAHIVQTMGPVLYGYDLVNEPKQVVFAPVSYWDIQRRAAEAIRAIDPATPIVVESNVSASPTAFAYLRPLPMDNVIYQLHMYAPGDYTHQGVGRALRKDGRAIVWPDPLRGWDIEYLRRVLEPVREFQRRHRCRIYVGEFSAIAWAPGADQYLRDCISLFEEYGWDWTYHAFREWAGWSVEHDFPLPPVFGGKGVPSGDNPRMRALVDAIGERR